MTGEKFAEIVTKRANERVQEKIKIFEQIIEKAFKSLTGSASLYDTHDLEDARSDTANRIILTKMLVEGGIEFLNDWPKLLWIKEEEKVTIELLSMMDEMQKALLSPGPKEDDCKMEGYDKVKAEE
jgi:hypothetical protein